MAHQKLTVAYNGNVSGQANTFSYSGSFDVFKGTEVVALLDNVKLTHTTSTINESASPREYTVDTVAKTIHIGGADLSSGTIIIRPETDVKGSDAPTPRATFTPGSSITSDDLNNNQLQLLRKSIEYDDQKLSSTGGTMTGDLTMGEDTKLIFEGATDDAYETTLTVTDPTADRTITLPNVTGTVVTTGDTATITATMLAPNSVDSSELVDGSVDNSHLADDAVNSDELASGAVDLDHMSANSVGEHQYVDASIKSAHIANDQIDSQHLAAGSVDLEHMASASVDSDNIVNDTIVNADINSAAAIAHSKLANVTSGQILVGNGSNVPTAVAVSGDVTLANTGAVTIATGAVEHAMLAGDAVDGDNIADDSINSEHYVAGSIDNEHIADDAIDSEHYAAGSIDNDHIADTTIASGKLAGNIAHSKLANVTDGQILVGNGSNVPTAVAVSGDVTIANTGAVTIANDAVEIGMIGCEQTTISDSDSHIPTSGAVVDYVAAQIAPIGGLEVIADDESFPNTIPAAGVVISITDAAGLSVNSSGVSTNGDALDNSTITINNFPTELRGGATVGGVTNADPYVFGSGAGLMVQSTGSSHTYNYHQALIRESDFVRLSGDIDDFNQRYRVAADASGVRTGVCGADGTGSGSYPCDGDMCWFTGSSKMYVFDAPAASTSNANLDAAWKEVSSVGDYKILTVKNHDQEVGGSGPTYGSGEEEYDLFDGNADASITNAAQLIVVLNGVIQKPNSGTFDGSEEGFYLNDTHGIKFCDPPPSGSTLFVTQIGSATTINTPGTGSISNSNMFASGVVNAAAIGTGAVEHAKLGADCVDGDNIGDDVINSEHIAAGAIDLEHMSSESVDEDNLHISNAGTNGQFLQKSSNSGGLTWASVSSTPEGEAVLSTTNSNEASTKFLRADGDGTCSWQIPPGTTINNATANELVTVASTTTQLDAEAKLTFDGDKLFIGGGGDRTVAGNAHNFVIEGTGAAPSTALLVMTNTNDANGAAIRIGKSRATSLGGNTATSTGDNLGQVEWLGNDGSAPRVGGRIQVIQESDVDTNSVPAYMKFMVTGDAQTNPYEHMRLRAGPTGTDGRLIIAPPITNNGNATDGYNQGEINLSNWNINQDDRYARIYSYNSGNNYTIGVKFQSGKTGTTWMNIKGNAEIDGNFNDTSDIALKENVVALSSTWNAVKQLKPCTFDWKPQTDVKDSSKVIVDGWSSVGFIAQEVESVIPLLVSGEDGAKSINTIGLVSQLTKALQEAMTKIETLETKVAALEAG